MKNSIKIVLFLLVIFGLLLSGCSPADVASENLSKAADNFEINRRIIFYDAINGDYIAVIEGLCSLGNYDSAGELSVTCKTGADSYEKHFLGLSDNVTYISLQLDPAPVNTYNVRIILRPSTVIPDVELDLP